ncbi:MAG: M67 family metallopeptidase [Bacteroidota bacterium]
MSQPILSITESAKKVIIDHLEATFPNEGCGFFFGKLNGEERIVTLSQPVQNVKEGDQRRRFEIAPIDYMKAERFAIENDLDLLGVFHSHPNHPAVPSVHDLNQAVPVFSYIIASIQDGQEADFTSWRVKSDVHEFEAETVKLLITEKR